MLDFLCYVQKIDKFHTFSLYKNINQTTFILKLYLLMLQNAEICSSNAYNYAFIRFAGKIYNYNLF